MTFLNMTDELNYQQIKYQVNQKLQSLIVNQGYVSFEPTFFEDYETFVLKNKRVKKELMVKFIDNDGKILVLRPDITTSLMGQIIPKWQHQEQLKIFYNSTIFKRNSMGQLDTIRQFGVELLGHNQIDADAEILNLATKIFKNFSLDYVIVITDTQFLDSIMKDIALNESNQSLLKDILFRKSSNDLERFVKEYVTNDCVKDLLLHIFKLQGTIKDIENMLKKFKLSEPAQLAFHTLKKTCEDIDTSSVMIDLSLVSTYDYYDGILFKGYLRGRKDDVLSGGRYDPLTENYGIKVPAIGFTLNTQELIKEVLSYE